MSAQERADLAQEIIARAKALGADLAGIARVEDLKISPSHVISEKLPDFGGVGTKEAAGRKRGSVEWPREAKSAIVIALAHPPEKPELDWWVLGGKSAAGNTAGNKLLIATVNKLAEWLEQERSVRCFRLPYHIEHGGIYMKDTAVLAGLGCIGKNNLLLTPEFGPRQRLRVMLVDIDLPSTGPTDFDPCSSCAMPCRAACPMQAFSEKLYTAKEYGLDHLPGRNGVYSRPRCNQQMEFDVAKVEPVVIAGRDEPGQMARFCRRCELVCPVGAGL